MTTNYSLTIARTNYYTVRTVLARSVHDAKAKLASHIRVHGRTGKVAELLREDVRDAVRARRSVCEAPISTI